MPEIPTRDSLGRRPVPRSSRSVQGYNAGQEAEAYADSGRQMQDVGAKLEIEGEKRQAKKDKFQYAQARSQYLQADIQAREAAKNNPDYKLAAEQYQTTMKKYAAQTSGLISDPEQRAYFQLDADNDFARGSSDINDYVRSKQIDAGRGQYITLKDGNLNGAINATSEGDSIAFINTQNALIDGAVTSGYMDAESAAKERITIPQEVALGRYNNLSSTEKLEVINSRKTKPDPNNKHVEGAVINPTDVINLTMQVEGGNREDGGYVHTDGASANPAIYGINRGAWPKQFDEALKIRDTQGVEAGREYARKFYKEEFYDKRDVGKYTPDVQKVLFDGTFNHYPGFGDKLVAAADKGATAKELIAMRWEEYQRLGKKPEHAPSLQGWMNRLSEVERNVGGPFGGASATYEKKGDIYDYIPADKWVEMEKQAVADARVESKLASEENILKQIENQNTFMDLISDPEQTTEQKILQINKADLTGQITEEFGEEARRYLNSVEKINATTDPKLMADIVTRMYDLNAMSDMSEADYLEGVKNIKQEIISLRADGKLSGDDELKINNQMKTLMSNKISEATQAISFLFGEANKMIESQLPPEMRGEATRALFYSTAGKQEATQEEYKAYARKIIDGINSQRRDNTVKKINEMFGPAKPATITPDVESILKAKGYTMNDVKETAQKYGITEAQVIEKIKAK